MIKKIREQYDLVTHPDIQNFMPYQHIISLLEFGTTYDSKGYYLARENCPYAILFYCESGQGKIIHQETSIDFTKGDTVIMPAGTSHILISHPQDPFIAKWIDVSGNAVNSIMTTYGIFAPAVFTGVDTDGLIESYHQTITSSLPPWEVVSSIILMLTAIVHTCTLPTLKVPQSQGQLAHMIKTYIDHHMQDKDLSVSKIADRLSLSLSKTTKIFQKTFGIGPHSYIIQQKINNSKLLLRSTDLPIKTIAEAMGFSDSNYFFYFFKKNAGVTPAAFRRMEHQKLSDMAT